MKLRKIIGIGLTIVILAMTVMVVMNKDEWFTNIVNVKYADGCIESYTNGELTTPICVEGRAIEKRREEMVWGQQPVTPTTLWD